MSTGAELDARYHRASPLGCAGNGQTAVLGKEVQWTIAPGVIACGEVQTPSKDTVWHGHLVNLNVFFAHPVAQEHALAVARTLLPADAKSGRIAVGGNNDASTKPDGSCLSQQFGSKVLGQVVTGLNPTWTDRDQAEITLYTGAQTSEDGSTVMFNPARVRLASIGIGKIEPGAHTEASC